MAVNAYLSPWLKAGFLNNNGQQLANGLLYSYQAGTTVPAATYTDATASTPNTNPITLNARGEVPQGLFIPPGVGYKFVLADQNNATIWTVDNAYAQTVAQSGSFSATGTGFSGTAPTFNCSYTVVGNVATVCIGEAFGTSNATTFGLTGIPSVLIPPSTAQLIPLATATNNTATVYSAVSIFVAPGTNQWSLSLNGIALWTASGTKGITGVAPVTFTYLLI